MTLVRRRRGAISQAYMPILFLIVFIDLVGFGLVIPLLPFYAERFGASPLQMTLLFAVYSLMSMLAAPLWGRLSDRIGRRPVLMASMAAAAVATRAGIRLVLEPGPDTGASARWRSSAAVTAVVPEAREEDGPPPTAAVVAGVVVRAWPAWGAMGARPR